MHRRELSLADSRGGEEAAAKKTKEQAAFILSMMRASQNSSCIIRMRQCKKCDGVKKGREGKGRRDQARFLLGFTNL